VAGVPELERGRFADLRRSGNEVQRKTQTSNAEVHRFLRFLEDQGFEQAPRFLGMTEDGYERLTYIEGITGYPPLSEALRSDEALISVAGAIRGLHDASQGFQFSKGFEWHGYEWATPVLVDCVGHFDLAPWNFVFHGPNVVGIIDWDTVGPSSRTWDLALAAHHFVPFHPSEDLATWGWPSEPHRRRRLRLLISAYGGSVSPAEVVDCAVLRLYGVGAYISQQVRHKNPAFDVQAREDHAAGFFRAAVELTSMRPRLL
jgi:Phosphotransferase enzyme family